MDGIEQTKEYYDARMTSKKGSMKATAPAAQETQKQTQCRPNQLIRLNQFKRSVRVIGYPESV